MRTFKRISASFLGVLILFHCILGPAFAAEATQDKEKIRYTEFVDPDTVLIYPVSKGNLYFGNYDYETAEERARITHLVAADPSITKAVIPAAINGRSVISIALHALDSCTELRKLVIPASVVYVGSLIDCVGLRKIIVEKGNPCYFTNKGALYHYGEMNDNKVDTGSALIRYPAAKMKKSFDILDGIQTVDVCCFRGAKHLKSVGIPSSVNTIASRAFESCYNLEDIVYDGSATQWQEIDRRCKDLSFYFSEIHYTVLTEREERNQVIAYVIGWGIFPLLTAVLIWVLMRKSIQERKRYLQYCRNIECRLCKTDRSIFTFSNTIAHIKPINPAVVCWGVGAVAIILALFIDKAVALLAGRQIRGIRVGGIWEIIFGPLHGAMILLVFIVISMCLIILFRKKVKIGRKNRIPMRIRIIKNKSGRKK